MLKHAITIFLKEFKCILRDKKTFIMGIMLPLFIVPALLAAVEFSFNLSQKNASNNLVVSMNDENNCFYRFCSLRDGVTVKEVLDPSDAIDKGEIAVYFSVDNNLDEKILKGEQFKITMNYSESSMGSMMSVGVAAECESDFRQIIESGGFRNVNQLYELIEKNKDFRGEHSELTLDNSTLYLNMLAPFMIILYCFITSSGTAVELSAGEKERCTWEPLLATGTDRRSIIIGKILCSSLTGFMSAMFATIGLFGYIILTSKTGLSGISLTDVLFLSVTNLLSAMLMSSVCYTVGMCSKSYKEYQTYFLPLSVLFAAPGLLSSSIEINKIGFFELSVPILNIICVMKEFLCGRGNLMHFAILFIWLLIYVFVIYKMDCKLIEKEGIIFRE